jgi:hypothetical protein
MGGNRWKLLTAGRDTEGRTWAGVNGDLHQVSPLNLVHFGAFLVLLGMAALGNRDDWPCADIPVADDEIPADTGLCESDC